MISKSVVRLFIRISFVVFLRQDFSKSVLSLDTCSDILHWGEDKRSILLFQQLTEMLSSRAGG